MMKLNKEEIDKMNTIINKNEIITGDNIEIRMPNLVKLEYLKPNPWNPNKGFMYSTLIKRFNHSFKTF